MYITELVLQGVRAFVSPKKMAFKKGMNVVLGENGKGKTTVVDILLELFYQRPPQEALPAFQSAPASGACRAGMSFESHERLYRKVADFSQGATNLSRFNPQSNAYEALSQDAAQIAQFFKEELRLPRPEVYRLLYASFASEFPGFHFSSSSSLPAPTPGGVVENVEAVKHELQQMRKLREGALRIKQLQFELDGVHKEQFEFADIIKKETDIKAKMAEVQKELQHMGSLPEIPDDIESRAEAYDKAVKRSEAEIPMLTQGLHELKDNVGYSKPEPLEKDGQFIGGGIGALVAIVGASFAIGKKEIFNIPQKLYILVVAAIAILGIVASVMRLIKFLSAQDEFNRINKEIQVKSEKLKAVERKFEIETSVVRNLMKALSADSTSEMFSTISRIKAHQDRINEFEGQLSQLRGRPQYSKAVAELPKLKERAARIDQELQLISSSPLEVTTLDAEIAHLESRLKKAGVVVTSEAAAANTEAWAKDIGREFIETMGQDAFYNPTQRLLLCASLGLDIRFEDLLQKLITPLDKNLGAFSFKNFSEPKADPDGTFSVMDREANQRVRFEQLEHFKQDLVYLALKFTLLQFLTREISLPVILDSTFQKFDSRMSPVIAKAIKFLSQQAQVILLTDDEAYAQGADAVIQI